MGLRAASVRRPHAEVMAPALTESNQTPSFKLPPGSHHHHHIHHHNHHHHPHHEDIAAAAVTKGSLPLPNGNDALPLSPPQQQQQQQQLKRFTNGGMSSPPTADAMGLQKVSLDDIAADLLKADDDADADAVASLLDELPANAADEIMQAFKAMDGSTTMSSTEETLNADLLSVMNMSVDDAHAVDEQEEEEVARERLAEAHRRQALFERKIDVLTRRVRRQQVRSMGAHISTEVAGVYEHVARTQKRSREQPQAQQLEDDAESAPDTEQDPSLTQKISYARETMEPLTYGCAKNLLRKLEYSKSQDLHRLKGLADSGSSSSLSNNNNSSSDGSSSKCVVFGQWTAREKTELRGVAGNLDSEVRVLQAAVDSEATESSSGGESCDEGDRHPSLQSIPIKRRASWRRNMSRASIASRWMWLQTQISDLEHKITQHHDLHRKIRTDKGAVQLGGAPCMAAPPDDTAANNCLNGYRGQLPGMTIKSPRGGDDGCGGEPEYPCARVRPLVNFRKRRLLQLRGLDIVSKKAARPATLRCSCRSGSGEVCALCTGRTDPMRPRDHVEYAGRSEALGLLDPAYHPVISLEEDVPSHIYAEALMRTGDWQQRMLRVTKAPPKHRGDKDGSDGKFKCSNKEKRKYVRALKPSTASALSAKLKNRVRVRKPHRRHSSSVGRTKKRVSHSYGSDGGDEELDALLLDAPMGESPMLTSNAGGGRAHKRDNRTGSSYDIDNIIIPYSVAAMTRVEKLPYKEILTPKWRRVTEPTKPPAIHVEKNNGAVKTSQSNDNNGETKETEMEEQEDVSDLMVALRHEKCEEEERKKFLSYIKLPLGYGRSRANRRIDSRAESSGANTPDPMSPAPPPQQQQSAASVNDAPLPPPAPTPTPASAPAQTVVVESKEGKEMVATVTSPPTPSIEEMLQRRRGFSNATATRREESRAASVEREAPPPYDRRAFPLTDADLQQMQQVDTEMLESETLKLGSADSVVTMTNMNDANDSVADAEVVDRADVLMAGDEGVGKSTVESTIEGVVATRGSDGALTSKASEAEHDSEATESAYGDEDPNDPEWDVIVEGARDR